MALTLWIVSLVVAAITIADQMRRAPSAWTAADRERGYWVTWTALAGLLYLGPIMAIVYVIAIVPRFAHSSGADDGFRRTGAAPPPRAEGIRSGPAPPPRRAAAPPPLAPERPPPTATPPAAPARLWSGTSDRDAPPAAPPPDSIPEAQQRRKLVIDIDDI